MIHKTHLPLYITNWVSYERELKGLIIINFLSRVAKYLKNIISGKEKSCKFGYGAAKTQTTEIDEHKK